MRDELLSYYERELTFLRQLGAEFAEKYPKIASRLVLEPTQCEDPHVERLIEAFSFLAARVHLKIDDEFPEITEALLSIVYPHFIRPIPSMTVVEMFTDPEQAGPPTGTPVPRNSILSSRPIDGLPCKFRTSYDVTIFPLAVTEALWRTPDRLNPPVKASGSVAAMNIQLKCLSGQKMDKLKLGKLRFYLHGEGNLVHNLYELLSVNTTQILLRDINPNSRRPPVVLPASKLQPVGFGEEEALLPYPRRSFMGYRYIQEYFNFPEKFLFLEISGLEALATAGFQDGFEIVFLLSRFERPDRQQTLEVGVSAKSVRMNCTPAVNLFPQTAEPILLTQNKTEYRIVPDVRRPTALEVFSVEEVWSSNPQTSEITHFEPFYSYRHGSMRDKKQTFWHSVRRPSQRRNDEGTEVYLTLVDMTGRAMRPDFDAITTRTICTNRDLPGRVPFGNENGDLEPEGLASIRKIVSLRKPTATQRPPTGKGSLWRLISHLSLNYLSLVDEGRDAFQEVLRLYDFAHTPFIQKQIGGITQLSSRPHFARIISENGISFIRGTHVDIELDEEQYVGAGVYLFASVLERFLGLYSTLNSFSQVRVTTRQRKEILREWPPRAGQQIIL